MMHRTEHTEPTVSSSALLAQPNKELVSWCMYDTMWQGVVGEGVETGSERHRDYYATLPHLPA